MKYSIFISLIASLLTYRLHLYYKPENHTTYWNSKIRHVSKTTYFNRN